MSLAKRAGAGLAVLVFAGGCSLVLDFSELETTVDATPPDAPVADAALQCPASEPNDDLATAQPIVFGVTEAAICGDNDDFYAFMTNGTDEIFIALTYSTAAIANDLDLELYSQAGELLNVASGIEGRELVARTATQGGGILVAGTYVIRVYGRSGSTAANNDYQLSVGTTAPAP